MENYTVYDIGEPELTFISDSASQVLSVTPLSLSHVSDRLLTQVAYIDDGKLLQGYFVYDTNSKTFISNISGYLGGSVAVTITAADAAWSTSYGETFVVAYIDHTESSYLQTGTGNRIALVQDGVLITNDLINKASGEVANIGVSNLHLSSDATQLVFSTAANNLLNNIDTNDAADVMLLDILGSTLERVSQVSEDDEGDTSSYALAVTHKGDITRVLFETTSTTFSIADTNEKNDIYLASIAPDFNLNLISEALDNSASSTSLGSALMQDDEIFFVSDADDIVANDNNQSNDIFATSVLSGETRRVTEFLDSQLDTIGVVDYQLLDLNQTASRLLFSSNLSNVSGSDSSVQQIYSLSLSDNGLNILSQTADGDLGNDTSVVAVMDASGRNFSYQTEASNLIDNPSFTLMVDAVINYDAQIVTSATQGITGLDIELWGSDGASESKLASLEASNGEVSIDSAVDFNFVKLSADVPYSNNAINLFDVLATVGHIVGTAQLSGAALEAADVNNDDSVNLFDVLAIVQHIVSDTANIDTFDLLDGSNKRITHLDTLQDSQVPHYQIIMNGDVDFGGTFYEEFVGPLDLL
jgi:hypothetical protein